MLRQFLINNTLYLQIIVFLYVLLSGQIICAAEAENADGLNKLRTNKSMTKGNALIITSQRLVSDNKRNTAVFSGTVMAKRGDITLFAQKMIVYYTGNAKKIKMVTATGGVKLVHGDRMIMSETAQYVDALKKITFTGMPKAVQGKNIISGSKIIYLIESRRSIIDNSSVKFVK